LKALKIMLLIQWVVGSLQCHLFAVSIWFRMVLLGCIGFQGGDGIVITGVGNGIRKLSLVSSASVAVDWIDGYGLGRVLVVAVGLQRA